MGFCNLKCCGTFCILVSIPSAILMFAFFLMLNQNTSVLDIGNGKSQRKNYGYTALYVSIIYIGFIFASIGCIFTANKQNESRLGNGYVNKLDDDEEISNESAPLFQDKPTYESTGGDNAPIRSNDDKKQDTYQ